MTLYNDKFEEVMIKEICVVEQDVEQEFKYKFVLVRRPQSNIIYKKIILL